MAFLVVLVVVVALIFLIVSRVNAAKRRTLQQVAQMKAFVSPGSGPQVMRQGKVTVTVMPPTVEGMEQMSGMAQTLLKQMGGADGILNMPAVRDALRQAAEHPGQTTTVTTSSTGAESPFDGASNPFAAQKDVFGRDSEVPDWNSAPPQAGGFGTSAATPARRDEIGVARVLSSPSPTFDGGREVSLELDAIGAPKQRVTARLNAGEHDGLQPDARVYVRLDPSDSRYVTLLGTQANGHTLPSGTNRVDTLVLGPQLFARGAHGSAVVKTATEVAPSPGGGSWQLELEVTPERGWPYRAELLTTVSSVEKAQRICVAGAHVPVLYDPDDPKTMCVDSVALGYGNPFAV